MSSAGMRAQLLQSVGALLRSEIVEVTGCTEPASVALAFLSARRHLSGPFDPASVRAQLSASAEVLRNASTAVVPLLNRRGLRTVVAAGLSSRSGTFNLFPGIDKDIARIFLQRRSWLKVTRMAGKKGVYVKAVLSTPIESVTVVIQGRHDEIRIISRNGVTLSRTSPQRPQRISMRAIIAAVGERDRRLEKLAQEFILRQVRGDPQQSVPKRVAALVRARMCGSPLPVMTITGSGNHGIFLGVPFFDLYRQHGARVLPAALFALLTVIHMTAKRSRISDECGLATKAAPALAAGLAFAQGANSAQIRRLMTSVSEALHGTKCHGARASCGRKAERAMRVVLAETKTLTAEAKRP